jgi:hypothetical protein
MIGLVCLDVRHRLLAALRQAVPARLPVIEATDKDAVGFYTANDFVTTSLSEKVPGIERFRMHLDALADCGREPKHLTLKPIGGL